MDWKQGLVFVVCKAGPFEPVHINPRFEIPKSCLLEITPVKKLSFAAMAFVAMVAASLTARADIVVDNSPDTVGVVHNGNYSQIYGAQYLGDQFTWAGGLVTGGSIFSGGGNTLGYSVVFVILPGNAPGAGAGQVPVLQFTTTIDLVDTLFASIDATQTRKHASIAPTFLAAGNYWFYMAGNGNEIAQGTGAFGDGTFDAGFDANPDLEAGPFALGNTFFQLESIPEPSSLELIGMVGFGIVLNRRRKNQA